MYDADALLDELAEVVTSHDVDEDDLDLADKVEESLDLDDELDEEPDLDADSISDLDEEAEELASSEGDLESWSDDPVRMYLTQMGEIPLLTRQQEIALAKRIELTRRSSAARCWSVTTSCNRPSASCGGCTMANSPLTAPCRSQ